MTDSITMPPVPDPDLGFPRTVTHVLPSAHWSTAVVIVVSKCHHRHVRPASMGVKVGDTFNCNLCSVSDDACLR